MVTAMFPSPRLLGLNESPYPPLPSVRKVIRATADRAHRYPPFHPDRLARRIAGWCGVDGDAVAVGSGSVGVALQLLQAVVRPGDRMVYAWPGFDAYPMLATMAGAEPVPVPLLPDGRQDLATLAGAIDATTSVVVVCNPHNPTGSLVTASEFAEFLARVPERVTVLLDEAYIEFVRHPAAPESLPLLAGRPNLLVLRTFSKAYGLAALRVGYGLGDPRLVARIQEQQLPYGINAVATAAVEATLEADEELTARVDAVIRERERLHRRLATYGLPVLPSQANFLWLAAGPDTGTDRTVHALNTARIHIRHWPAEGIRLTVGRPEDGDAVLSVLAPAGSGPDR
ncbi:aminotransferase class I/II-fold pyridoxal phosphate-dependent enzyme [Streptomyces sp. Li-HN-5-11]|uniref:aminotransferase class I/II-fold pyridoxal phosphate-dependent enzyme n=1 Tax=Streptomyces sp. Li-HN-5-11 TaxID=3075432 RepID=UPI0028B23773|nr:aminotransferase class I/II-fold pyridoxal phosphate-dependent enzyme [Streptomyces sp. Li-HN-5-11]WNM33609.1 aminotransferase class I/II-fold pyridoxal phosphate-dependent enzyme [Streptomyces sp. Li-HN-5-11]